MSMSTQLVEYLSYLIYIVGLQDRVKQSVEIVQ